MKLANTYPIRVVSGSLLGSLADPTGIARGEIQKIPFFPSGHDQPAWNNSSANRSSSSVWDVG